MKLSRHPGAADRTAGSGRVTLIGLSSRQQGAGSILFAQRLPDVDPDPAKCPQGVAGGEDEERRDQVMCIEEPAKGD